MKSLFRFLAIIFIFIIVLSIIISIFSKGKNNKNSIALIKIQGEILNSDNILQKIRKVENQKNYKGLILRINSPGGAVAPSQEIFREVKRLKKPVIVSISSLGASGAYYIACAADKIVAEKGSLVGSVGVIMNLPYLKELYKKIGYETQTIKSGELKDTGNPERKLSPKEKKYLQDLINQTYQQFLSDVASSRNLNIDSIKQYCDGRIFNGTFAKKIGFIDTIGNYYDAVNIIRKELKNNKLEIFEIKEKKDFFNKFFDNINSSIKNIKPSAGTYFLFNL